MMNTGELRSESGKKQKETACHGRLERVLYGRSLSAEWIRLEQGISVTVYGGDLAHIGAVSVADPSGEVKTLVFPGHKDQFIAKPWAEAIYQKTGLPVTVSAGIHYDNLSREGIARVLALAEDMRKELLEQL